MDEFLISYLYGLSQHQEYHELLSQKLNLILYLVDHQIHVAASGTTDSISEARVESSHVCDNCRKRIFRVLHILTESSDEFCKLIDSSTIVEITIKLLVNTFKKQFSGDLIHEYALKILINVMMAKPESFDDLQNIKDLLPQLAN